MMRRLLAVAAVSLCLVTSNKAIAGNDAVLAQFFAIWDDDAHVTPKAVQNLYAARVHYYGRVMTVDEVYANKRAFIRRWPSRRYAVVPGSSSEQCDRTMSRCHVGVTLAWHARSAARGAEAGGLTRVSLDLAREEGALKITRESGQRAR